MLKLRKVLLLLRAQPRVISVHSERFYAKDTKDDKSDRVKKSQKQAPTESQASADEESAAARLNKLLASMQTDTTTMPAVEIPMAKPGEKIRKRREEIKKVADNQNIFAAAKRVADLLDDGKETKKSEMELLSKLLNYDVPTTAKREKKPDESLSDLMASMKVEHKKIRHEQESSPTRGEYVRRTMQRDNKINRVFGDRGELPQGDVNLFGGENWGVFKNIEELRDLPDLCTTWRDLEQRELKMLVTQPPSNYFEKVARWTEQGKVWHFPIDNEQGMDEERNVDFTEHIFLEQHLETWCPNKGPIRHFMELVCVGLSKNPYITAREKKEHILWYRDYFESKKETLKELMQTTPSNAQTQQISQS